MTDHRKAAPVPRRRRPEVRCERRDAAAQRLTGARGRGALLRCADALNSAEHLEDLRAVVVHRHGRVAVVTVAGEIDLRTSEILRAMLDGLVDDGFSQIVVDFADVRFCDATGLGALVSIVNRLRAGGGALRLSRVRPPQARLLRITGLERIFPSYASLADAVRAGSEPTSSQSG